MKKTAAIALMVLLGATPAGAQAERSSEAAKTQPATVQSSSEKVRDNPTAQYVLVKTVVGQATGVVDARAVSAEPEGYNLLKYCWTAENVLGDWAERAGLTGAMIVRALETRSWQRDLARTGYPEAPLAEAIGQYEATLVAAGFTEAARARAMEDGRARFMPYVLHQVCQAQQLNADDPIPCDYWMFGKTDKPMSFAGETVYSVRWLDGSTANGRFDPEQSRSTGTVTLRLRPPPKTTK